MNFNSDSVAETVTEVFAIAFFGNYISCDFVDIGALFSGADRVNGGFLRPENRFINIALLIGNRADSEGSCHVAVIILIDRAEVKGDEISAFNFFITRYTVRH